MTLDEIMDRAGSRWVEDNAQVWDNGCFWTVATRTRHGVTLTTDGKRLGIVEAKVAKPRAQTQKTPVVVQSVNV